MVKDLVKELIEKYKINLAKKYQKQVVFSDKRLSKINGYALSKEQITEINEYYKLHYGESIDCISHLTYTAYSGIFDVKYFPEYLYIPEFEYFMNPYMYYNKTFYDKNVTSILANNLKIYTPLTFFKCIKGLITDSENRILNNRDFINEMSNIGECFVKETTDTGGGSGCFLANFQHGIDIKTGVKVEDFIIKLGNDFVIQDRLKCHNSISKLYPNSVNTFRILTYRWRNTIIAIPAIMRIGQGGNYIDNASKGGMFVSVNENGLLGKTALTESGISFLYHPDTNIKFENYEIPLFEDVRKAAINLHTSIPQVGVVNWDFTIDESGNPVLIEGNMCLGGIWVFQMAHGKGAFGENTSEILEWIKLMKKTPVSKRSGMLYGNY